MELLLHALPPNPLPASALHFILPGVQTMNSGGTWTLNALTLHIQSSGIMGSEHPLFILLLPPGPTCHLPPALAP